MNEADLFEKLSARLDLRDEKLMAISGGSKRFLTAKDKDDGLITRVSRHQTWLTILTTWVVLFFAL